MELRFTDRFMASQSLGAKNNIGKRSSQMISYTLMTYPMIYYTNSTHHFLCNSNNAFGYVLSHKNNPKIIHCRVNGGHKSECKPFLLFFLKVVNIIILRGY